MADSNTPAFVPFGVAAERAVNRVLRISPRPGDPRISQHLRLRALLIAAPFEDRGEIEDAIRCIETQWWREGSGQ